MASCQSSCRSLTYPPDSLFCPISIAALPPCHPEPPCSYQGGDHQRLQLPIFSCSNTHLALKTSHPAASAHVSPCPLPPPPTSTLVFLSPPDGPSPQLTAGSGAPGCREGRPRGLACALWLDSFLLFTRRWKERVSRLSGLHKQWEQRLRASQQNFKGRTHHF